MYSHPLPSNKICLPDCVWWKGATVRRLGKLLKRKQAVGKLSIWVTSWEDNYERHIRFRSPHSNFRAITRLETLATQAMRRSKTSLLKYHLSGAVCVFFFSITAGHGKSVERWTEEDSVHLSSFNNGDCSGISDGKLKHKFDLSSDSWLGRCKEKWAGKKQRRSAAFPPPLCSLRHSPLSERLEQAILNEEKGWFTLRRFSC